MRLKQRPWQQQWSCWCGCALPPTLLVKIRWVMFRLFSFEKEVIAFWIQVFDWHSNILHNPELIYHWQMKSFFQGSVYISNCKSSSRQQWQKCVFTYMHTVEGFYWKVQLTCSRNDVGCFISVKHQHPCVSSQSCKWSTCPDVKHSATIDDQRQPKDINMRVAGAFVQSLHVTVRLNQRNCYITRASSA